MNDEQKKALREYMAGFLDAVFAAFEGRALVRPEQERTDLYERGLTRGEAVYADVAEKETARILGILDQETLHALQVLYFGCIASNGHCFWETENRSASGRSNARKAAVIAVWPRYDADLCPEHLREEGLAVLRHNDDWTALSFWDYSDDHRPGSNSNFFAHGTFTFDQMCQIAEARFPSVWKRYKFKVRLLETLEEKA